MVDVNDLDGAGKLLGGDVPDPGGAVADDDALGCGVETAPYRLAIDPLCEGGRLRVGVAAGRAVNEPREVKGMTSWSYPSLLELANTTSTSSGTWR